MFGIDKIKVICLLNCLTLGLLSHVGDVNYYKTEGKYSTGLFQQNLTII